MRPVAAIPHKARDLDCEDGPYFFETDGRDHALEAGALRPTASRAPQVIVDHLNVAPAPRARLICETRLPTLTFEIVVYCVAVDWRTYTYAARARWPAVILAGRITPDGVLAGQQQVIACGGMSHAGVASYLITLVDGTKAALPIWMTEASAACDAEVREVWARSAASATEPPVSGDTLMSVLRRRATTAPRAVQPALPLGHAEV